MKLLFTIVFLSISIASIAQMSDYTSLATGKHGTMTVRRPYHEVYKVVEQMPVFPGGDMAFMRFLSRTPYPKEAIENGIEGKVYIKVIIDTAGNVTQPLVTRSSGSYILDDATLSHLRNMPKWQPGRQRGQAVYVELTFPVYFKLD